MVAKLKHRLSFTLRRKVIIIVQDLSCFVEEDKRDNMIL